MSGIIPSLSQWKFTAWCTYDALLLVDIEIECITAPERYKLSRQASRGDIQCVVGPLPNLNYLLSTVFCSLGELLEYKGLSRCIKLNPVGPDGIWCHLTARDRCFKQRARKKYLLSAHGPSYRTWFVGVWLCSRRSLPAGITTQDSPKPFRPMVSLLILFYYCFRCLFRVLAPSTGPFSTLFQPPSTHSTRTNHLFHCPITGFIQLLLVSEPRSAN